MLGECKLKTKQLCEQMTLAHVYNYIDNHPEYRIPTKDETDKIKYDKVHIGYWVDYLLQDRQAICLKKNLFSSSHPNIKRDVILVKD